MGSNPVMTGPGGIHYEALPEPDYKRAYFLLAQHVAYAITYLRMGHAESALMELVEAEKLMKHMGIAPSLMLVPDE